MPDIDDLNEQEKTILKLWEQGFTGQEIGHQIGKTRSAVLGKLNRLRKRGLIGYKVQITRVEHQKVSIKHKKPDAVIKKSIVDRPRLTPFVFKIKNRDRQPPVFTKPARVWNGNPVTLMELEFGMCKYSVSEDNASQHMFCGKPIYKRVYCEDHHKLCYIEPHHRKRNSA